MRIFLDVALGRAQEAPVDTTPWQTVDVVITAGSLREPSIPTGH